MHWTSLYSPLLPSIRPENFLWLQLSPQISNLGTSPDPSHAPPWHQSPLLVTSGGHHWRLVQTCSFEDPYGSDTWWWLLKLVQSMQEGSSHPTGMLSCWKCICSHIGIDFGYHTIFKFCCNLLNLVEFIEIHLGKPLLCYRKRTTAMNNSLCRLLFCRLLPSFVC